MDQFAKFKHANISNFTVYIYIYINIYIYIHTYINTHINTHTHIYYLFFQVQTCNDVVVTVTGNEKSLVGFRCDQFVKRGIVAGGNKHVEVTPEIQDAGEKAVRILNAKSNATYREVAMEIRNPTAQVRIMCMHTLKYRLK